MSYSVYTPSGVVPTRAIALCAACVAAVLPVASLYAFLILHLPVVLDVVVSFAFVFLLVVAVNYVCRAGKARSPLRMGRFGLFLGVCGWYVQWSAWALFQADAGQGLFQAFAGVLDMATRPADVVERAVNIVSSADGGAKVLVIGAWMGELWMQLFFPYFMGKMRPKRCSTKWQANGPPTPSYPTNSS